MYTRFSENFMSVYALLADQESKMLHCPYFFLSGVEPCLKENCGMDGGTKTATTDSEHGQFQNAGITISAHSLAR